jgi:hypothetical protein
MLIFVHIVDPWIPDDINHGKAEYLFFVLGGLMMANFFVYIFVARAYKYRTHTLTEDDLEENDDRIAIGDKVQYANEGEVNIGFKDDGFGTKM